MKNIFLKSIVAFLFLLASAKNTHAQTVDSTNQKAKITAGYLSFGIGWLHTNDITSEFGLHGFLSNHWGMSFTYRAYSFDALNKPDDYLTGTQNSPQDEIMFPTIWVSREFPTKFKAFRFVAQVGVSYVNYKETIFTPFPNSLVNYSTSKVTSQTIGGSINIKTELIPIRYMGLELGASAHINSAHTSFMLDFNLLLGVLRPKSL